MRWIAGIDGGGSKTAVLLRTVDGKETRTCRVGSIDPAEYGVEGYAAGLLAAVVVSLLSKGPGKDVEDLFDRAVDLKS